MSLLGIDVGTTGCKSVVFSHKAQILASAYSEYNFTSPAPGQAQLDSRRIWKTIKDTIAQAAANVGTEDPIRALSVSSLGESVVAVKKDRKILGPSLLLFDSRGNEYLEDLGHRLDNDTLYRINGNTLGSQYGLTKLMWIRDHQQEVYEEADWFLFWSGFVAFILGADPAADYSLANRSLVFDLDSRDWSRELLAWAGLERDKFPQPVPSGTIIGTVSKTIAAELNLSKEVKILSGTHDQCANALGCGVIESDEAMFGLGTYHTIVPVFKQRPDPAIMMRHGLNTEHHALQDRFVSFIYNQCGSIVKWFRNTFAAAEHRQAQMTGQDIYERLFAELPQGPSSVGVLPHFSAMGPPEFVTNSSGVFTGLRLGTSRGEILKGILEGSVFSLRESIDTLPETGLDIRRYRAAGGGSKSDAWLQICADILNRPVIRSDVTEAGSLGSAILAGVGTGIFNSFAEAIREMVKMGSRFEPAQQKVRLYDELYQRYRKLWSLLKEYLAEK
jgi:xylulokinase